MNTTNTKPLDLTETNKILIVDDDPATCELIAEVLRTANVETFSSTDSIVAGQRLLQDRFDAVFLDARMPAPDGLELTRRMRRFGLNQKAVIVMITGEREQSFLTRAYEAGVTFVLFKPVDRNSLLRLLRVTQGSIDRERRKFTRVEVRCCVSVELGQEKARGTTVDVSLCGLLVQANRRFPVGSHVRVNLDFEAGKSALSCSARVVRLVDPDAMGLELEELSLSDSHTLEEFLLQQMVRSKSCHTPPWQKETGTRLCTHG